MRRFVFFLIILTGITAFAVACNREDAVPKTVTDVYFVDSRLRRLLPYECEVIDAMPQDMANAVISAIIKGRDSDTGVLRIVPLDDDLLSVKVKDTVAYVDINSKIKRELKHNRETEKLFIFQIVNSLTSLKGIRFVKFTMDGAIHEDFLGFYDMRETFKFTYPE